MHPFSHIGIVGLGLLGGSLARALKQLPQRPHVAASSLDPGDLEAALRDGAIDAACPGPAEAASGADLVVYATPLGATLELLRAHRDRWAPHALVTDLAGLKAPVLARVREVGEAARYVGSHPMAGGEGSGYAASRAGLFHEAPVWLVRGDAPEAACAAVEALWQAVGARPAWTDPDAHDARMVPASHLPQLVSTALAAVLAGHGTPPEHLGPGGRELTRLAGSGPGIWRDVLERSGPRAAPLLRALARELERLAAGLEAGDAGAAADLMERTRRWKDGGGWS